MKKYRTRLGILFGVKVSGFLYCSGCILLRIASVILLKKIYGCLLNGSGFTWVNRITGALEEFIHCYIEALYLGHPNRFPSIFL